MLDNALLERGSRLDRQTIRETIFQLAAAGQIAGHDRDGTFYKLDDEVFYVPADHRDAIVSVGCWTDFRIDAHTGRIAGFATGPRPIAFAELASLVAGTPWHVREAQFGGKLVAEHEGDEGVALYASSPDELWAMMRRQDRLAARLDNTPTPFPTVAI